MIVKRHILILASCLLVFACGKNGDGDDFDKKGMFTNYADNLILPAYNTYKTSLTSLQTALNNFDAAPDLTTLAALQTAFLHTYTCWQACEIYEKTEPASDEMANENNNFYPTRIDSVNAYIARNDNSTTFIKSRNKNDKGLPAIEYLLFSRTLTQQQILDRFTIHSNAASYKTYLTSLVTILTEIQTSIINNWNTSYKQSFINNVGTDASSSFSALVNSLAQRTDDLKRHQVGIPAGYSGNVATANTNPTAVQAYYSNNSTNYMLLTLTNMKDVLQGKNTADGIGLYDYLKTLNFTSTFGGNLADDIITQIDVCIAKVNECGADYSVTVDADKPKADALFLETKKLLVLMKVDLPSAFGVSITYTDSDGD
jgi:predicted lipoprotein